jgi:predicted tellurium resistance membrane protein TerC
MNTPIEYSPLESYSQQSKYICISTTIIVIILLLFVLSPLKNYFNRFYALLITCIILIITIYSNYTNTIYLASSTNTNIFSNEWNQTKGNIICSHFFSVLLLVLLLSVVRMAFHTPIVNTLPVPAS